MGRLVQHEKIRGGVSQSEPEEVEECSFLDSRKDEEFVQEEDYVSKMMIGRVGG